MPTKVHKFILVSDVHLSNSLPHAKPGPDGVTDRLKDGVRVLADVAEHAEAVGAPLVLVLGDLFDKPVFDGVTLREAMAEMSRAAEEYGLTWIIGGGNHELDSLDRFSTEFLDVAGVEGVWFMSGPARLVHDSIPAWLDFWWVPYGDRATVTRAIDECRREATSMAGWSRDILLTHVSVNGCTAGGWVCRDGLDPDWVCEGFDAVFSGHFHTTQTWGDTGLYLGSPVQIDYGAEGQPTCFWELSVDSDGGMDTKRIDLKTPRFFTRKLEDFPGSFKMFDVTKDTDLPRKNDYVRAVVECTRAEWAKYRERFLKMAADSKAVSELRACEVVHRPIPDTIDRLGDARPRVGHVDFGALARRYVELADTDGLDEARLIGMADDAITEVSE